MNRFLTRRRMLAAGAGAAVTAPAVLAAGAQPAGAVLPNRDGPANVPLLPRRVYDSRQPDSIMGGARLASGESVVVNVGSAEGYSFSLGVFVNCTVTDTIGWGWLTISGSDDSGELPIPQTSNVNWSTNGQTLANLALSAIGDEHSIEVRCGGSGATHFILDVQGYVPVTSI